MQGVKNTPGRDADLPAIGPHAGRQADREQPQDRTGDGRGDHHAAVIAKQIRKIERSAHHAASADPS